MWAPAPPASFGPRRKTMRQRIAHVRRILFAGLILVMFASSASAQLVKVPGTLKQISVGADGTVFGLQASGSVWRWIAGGEWENVPGTLSQISVGGAEHVWGLQSSGSIWR